MKDVSKLSSTSSSKVSPSISPMEGKPEKSRFHTLMAGVWQGALAIGIAVVGMVLPVEFFGRPDSLLLYLRPLEIVSVYASASIYILFLAYLQADCLRCWSGFLI